MRIRASVMRSVSIVFILGVGCLSTGQVIAYLVSADDLAARLAKFDTNNDGVITKEELTDKRLLPLFKRYDRNSDEQLTRDEIIAGMERDQPGSSAESGITDLGGGLGGNNPGRIAKPTGLGGGAPTSASDESSPVNRAAPGAAPRGMTARGQDQNAPATPSPFPAGLIRVGQVVPDYLKTDLDLSDKQIKQLEELERSNEARLKSILNARQFDLLQKSLADNVAADKPKGKGD